VHGGGSTPRRSPSKEGGGPCLEIIMADTSYSDMKAADNRGTAVSEVQLRPDGSARIHGWLNQSRRLDYELGPVRPFSYTPDSLLKLSLPGSLGPRLSMAAVKQSITPKAKRRGAPAPPASEDASPGASGLAATLSAVADVLGGAASPFKADPPPRGGAASAASSSSSLVGPCEPLGRAASSLVGLCEPGEHGVGYRFVKAWLPEKDTFLLCHVDGFKHSLEEVSRERAARIYLRHYAGLAEDAVPLLPAAEAAEEEVAWPPLPPLPPPPSRQPYRSREPSDGPKSRCLSAWYLRWPRPTSGSSGLGHHHISMVREPRTRSSSSSRLARASAICARSSAAYSSFLSASDGAEDGSGGSAAGQACRGRDRGACWV